MEGNYHIETLILRQLQQEASPAEQLELQQWLDASPENRQEYQALADIWANSPPALQGAYDTAAAWKKMQSHLLGLSPDEDGTATVIPMRSNRANWLVAASGLLLVLSTGWWLYREYGPKTTLVMQAQETDRKMTLPDGSIVYLRKGATVKYAEAFVRKQRITELSGEAYFEVVHDPNRPFAVKTAHALIEDQGTSFLVKGWDTLTEVVVAAGQVKFTDRDQDSRNITLNAGEKGFLDAHGLVRGKTTDSNFISWKTGVLDFHNTPLDQALQDVHDFYGINPTFAPGLLEEAREIKVTARFENQPIKDVLEEIKLITGLEWKQEKDTLVFYRK
jgi:ferric-dicitrate binding protein FerR (iron transport regulator)